MSRSVLTAATRSLSVWSLRIGDAAFDRGVKPPEAAFGFADFGAQRRQARGVILVLRRLPLHEAGEEIADALGREEAVGEPLRHQSSSLSIGMERPLQALLPCWAQVAQV